MQGRDVMLYRVSMRGRGVMLYRDVIWYCTAIPQLHARQGRYTGLACKAGTLCCTGVACKAGPLCYTGLACAAGPLCYTGLACKAGPLCYTGVACKAGTLCCTGWTDYCGGTCPVAVSQMRHSPSYEPCRGRRQGTGGHAASDAWGQRRVGAEENLCVGSVSRGASCLQHAAPWPGGALETPRALGVLWACFGAVQAVAPRQRLLQLALRAIATGCSDGVQRMVQLRGVGAVAPTPAACRRS